MFLLSLYIAQWNDRTAQHRKNLVSDKHSKTDIVLHMPTVHPVLLQMARTVLLDARYAQIMHPCTDYPWPRRFKGFNKK